MDDDAATLAVVVARLDDLRADVSRLRDEVHSANDGNVSRNEWLQRNAYVDAKFDAQGADISELRAELAAKRAPWWVILAAVLGVATFVVTGIPAFLP